MKPILIGFEFDNVEAVNAIVADDLLWHYKNFGKKQKMPFESFDEYVEAAYVKKMRNALKIVLGYYGKKVK